MDKNQCQGCQAGWPTTKINYPGGRVVEGHKVVGGYKGELCLCAKDMYTTSPKSIRG